MFRRFFETDFARNIAPEGAENIYLSRSKLGGLEGGAILETVIESNLKREGYRIFHPQKHSIAAQVAQYKAAKNIVGLDGSAFHLFGFVGRPDQNVAMILRRNSDVFQGINAQISSFCGISPQVINVVTADWIPRSKTRPGRYSFGQLNFQGLFDQLFEGGFIKGGNDWRNPRFREIKQTMRGFSESKGLDYFRVKAPDNQPRKRESST